MSFYAVLIVHIYRVLLITPVAEWGQLISYQQHVFDPHHLPATEEELSDYGMDKIAKLTDFYGIAQKVNFDGQEGEYQSLMLILMTQKRSGNCFVGLFSSNTGIIQYIKFCQS